MNKITYIFLFSIIFICCDKQKRIHYSKNSIHNTKESRKQFEINTRNDLLKLGNKYAYEKKFYEINKIIENKAESNKDTLGNIYAKTNIGLYYFNLFSNDSAYYYFSKAEKLSLQLKGNPHICEIFQYKADLLWCQKDFTAAETTAIKSLKNSKGNNIVTYSSYLTIANALFGMNNYDKSLIYYNKALIKLEELKKLKQYNELKTQTYNYIAKVYHKKKLYQKVIEYLKINVNLIKIKKTDLKTYSHVVNTIAYSKLKLNDKSSLLLFKEVEKIADSIKFVPTQVEVKTYMGEYYLIQQDKVKASTYLKDAQKLAHKNNIFEDELKILKLLEQANPNLSNFYSDRYIILNDSLQDVERATRDKFARIEFETDEITNQKEIVSKENNLLNKRIWIISVFGLLSLLVIVLWFMNKSQKAKTRELLLKQEQQKANEAIYQLMIDQQQQMEEGKNIEKQRISLELHDGVMGKLSAVRLNLYAALYKENLIENEVFSKQIDEIQEVEKEIRTIAHDLNSNLFSDNANFIGIVKELFTKIENHSQIYFTLQVSEAVNWDLINNSIKINLYRILQEALQNIEKYANAKNVFLTISLIESNKINIVISDDGIGFDTNKKSNGIGIKNMKARIVELNGKFNIQSELHQGTEINLTIPF